MNKAIVRSLALAYSPGDHQWFVNVYKKITSEAPYSYMAISFHQLRPEKFRITSNWFRETPGPMRVWMKK